MSKHTINWTRTATIRFMEVEPEGYLVAHVTESDYDGQGSYFASRSYDTLHAAVHLSLTGEIREPDAGVDMSRVGEGISLTDACKDYRQKEIKARLADLLFEAEDTVVQIGRQGAGEADQEWWLVMRCIEAYKTLYAANAKELELEDRGYDPDAMDWALGQVPARYKQ